jgi:tRNA dimethylallyltransferase
LNSNTKKPIPVILGPTASGKTSVGILLAQKINAEIISVDSRKVYKGLPIGTATPEGEWRDGAYWVENVAHHLMGHLSPDQPYTAGDFAKDADQLIREIKSRGHTPLLVGGTGFYFKSLDKGLPDLPPRDESFRRNLESRFEKEGGDILHQELKEKDPEAASHIRPSDPHKLIRALEVIHLTGRTLSSRKSAPKTSADATFLVLGLDFSKELLNQRIEERSKRMLDRGMIEEADALIRQGFSKTCPALASFGYREAVAVIEGKMARQDYLPALIKGTKAYAKRQRTWFRTQVQPTWFEANESSRKEEIAMRMKAFLERAN